MKYYATDTTIKNSWDQTIAAVWQRYPNPFSKHVLSEDTLERRVQGAKLFTKRLLIKTNPLPKWGQRFVSLRQVAVVEESILDRDQRLFVTYTRNIGYTSTMNVVEKCIYAPFSSSFDDSSASTSKIPSTIVKREAWISSQMRGFASVLQRFGVERYKHNAHNAIKGLNFALARLFPLHSPTTHAKSGTGSKLTAATAYAVTDMVVHKIENATAKAAAATGSSTI